MGWSRRVGTDGVDPAKIEAAYKNGVLPKKPEIQPRQIPVSTN